MLPKPRLRAGLRETFHDGTISFCAFKSRTPCPICTMEKKTADQRSADQNGRNRWNSSGEASAKCWQTGPKFARHTCRAITARSSSNAERAVTVNVGRLTTASASTSTTASLTPRSGRCSQVRCSASIVPAPTRLTTRTNQVNRLGNTYKPCEEQQLRALRMLASCPDGAPAFEKRCITKLVACGYCDRETRTGLHVDRYRITRAGQKAARAGQEAAAA